MANRFQSLRSNSNDQLNDEPKKMYKPSSISKPSDNSSRWNDLKQDPKNAFTQPKTNDRWKDYKKDNPNDRDYDHNDRKYTPNDRWKDFKKDNPNDGKYTPNDGKYTPNGGKYTPNDRKYTPNDRKYTPNDRKYTPNDRKYTPNDRKYGKSNNSFKRRQRRANINSETEPTHKKFTKIGTFNFDLALQNSKKKEEKNQSFKKDEKEHVKLKKLNKKNSVAHAAANTAMSEEEREATLALAMQYQYYTESEDEDEFEEEMLSTGLPNRPSTDNSAW